MSPHLLHQFRIPLLCRQDINERLVLFRSLFLDQVYRRLVDGDLTTRSHESEAQRLGLFTRDRVNDNFKWFVSDGLNRLLQARERCVAIQDMRCTERLQELSMLG